ncbi:TonB-dependent receptor [Acetobacter sp.]|uniref:TonB-dependent receptor n=1 Tax=Acetobacter sp. TaxID=440 RepID=UPI0039E84ED0
MKYRLHTLLAASALATSCYTSLSVAQTVAGSPATRPQAPIAPHAKKPDNIQGKKETILVKGRAASGALADYNKTTAALGPLGTRRTLDTPFSIMTVPHDVIVNQQSRNMNDLMAYLPSVQLEVRGDPNTSRPQSRGFEADVVANTRIDGLNAVSTTPYAAEQFDSLQVLNGLAGALYGAQNPAGTFEYGLKRPTDSRINRLVVGVDSIGTLMENADLSGRLGRNKWFGYRLNLLHGDGTTYVQDSWVRRNLVSADFDFRLDEKTTIEVDTSHYTYAQRGQAAGFAYSGTIDLPKAPDLSNPGLGQKYAGYNMETNTFLAKVKHKFNENWSVTLGGLYQDAIRQSFGNANTLINNAGDFTQTIAAATTANDFRVGSNLAYVNGRVHTGFITHDLVIGTNGYMMGNYNPTTGQTFKLNNGQAMSMYDPKQVNGQQPYYHGRYRSAYVSNQTLIVGDTLQFNKHWSIMGTLSWSWLHTDSWSNPLAAKHTHSSYDRAAAFSPMTSLIYKPTDNQTVYFTYGRAFQAGSIAPAGATNVNDYTAPLRSEEYEVGYKVMIRKMQINIAGFRMTRPYAFTDPTTHVFDTFGNQRNYGVEAQFAGYILPNLSLLGGMTWMDAQMGSTGVASTSHKEVVGAPPVQANVLLDYRLPASLGNVASRLAFNANVHYVGRRAANVQNTTFADSYVTLDLGTRFAFRAAHHPWMARFGVSNATNARYWASVYPTSLNGASASANNSAYAGLPRTFHFTLEADF